MSSSAPTSLKPEEAKALLDSTDTFLFDCDGVLWRGTSPVDGAKDVIEKLREAGKQVLFVTNNSTKARKTYTKKFKDVLGTDASENEIYGTARAAASYLQSLGFTDRVYVVGEEGITEELEAVGIKSVGGVDHKEGGSYDEAQAIVVDDDVKAVVVGLDRHFNYYKMAYAKRVLDRPDCLFVATNTDPVFPVPGRMVPGGGTMVAAVETCAKRSAVVVGKPERHMLDMVIKENNVDPSRAVMIGDNLFTDIIFGGNGGLKTLFVLSGASTMDDLQRPGAPRPTWVADSVAALLPAFA